MRAKSGPAAKPLDEKWFWQRLYDLAYGVLAPVVGKSSATILLRLVFIIAPAVLVIISGITSSKHFLEPVVHFVEAEYYEHAPIRNADVGTFTVAFAQLENDADDKTQHLILHDLQEDIKWIRVRPIHRTVSLDDTDLQKSISDGHAAALKILKESGAQILIWGTVLPDGQPKVPELFISSAAGFKHRRYPLNELLELPPIFEQQLASVLDLVVLSESIGLVSHENPRMVNDLKTFISKVEKLMVDTQSDSSWDEKSRVDVENALAQALWIEADVTNTTEPLAKAGDIFAATVKTYDPQKDWRQLAQAKQNLGVARLALARRETGFGAYAPTPEQQALLKSAIDDLNGSALIFYQHGGMNTPATLFDLRNLLSTMAGVGAQFKAWQTVDDAVSAYLELARMSPQERNTNGKLWMFFTLAEGSVSLVAKQKSLELGTDSDKTLGHVPLLTRQKAVEALQGSVSMLRYCLSGWTMEKYPLLSIVARSGLGVALLASAQLESGQGGGASLSEAAEQFREVIHDKQTLGERPTLIDRVILAAALSALGARDPGPRGTDQLEQAVRIYRDTLYPYLPERASADWFAGQASTAMSLQFLEKRKRSPEMLCEALTRSIVAEKGLAATGASFRDVIYLQNQADNTMRALRKDFGDPTAHECEVAMKEFLKAFGPR